MKWILPLAMLVASLSPALAADDASVLVSHVAKTRSGNQASGVVLPPFYRDVEAGGRSTIPGGGCNRCGFTGNCACEFDPKCRDNIWGNYCAQKQHMIAKLHGRCAPTCDPGIPLSTLFSFRSQCVESCGASDCGTSACSVEPSCALKPACAVAPAGCGSCGGGFLNGCGHSFCLHRLRGFNLFGGSKCSTSAGCTSCGGDGCAACGGSQSGSISDPTLVAPGIPVEPEAPVEMMPIPTDESVPSHSSAMPSARSAKLPKAGRYPLGGTEGR